MATEGAGSSDDRQSGIWSVLPSFDPAVDDIKEYVAKVKFIDGICPKKDRTMLAPRLAMLCTREQHGIKFVQSAQTC